MIKIIKIIQTDLAAYRARLHRAPGLKGAVLIFLFHPGFQLLMSIRLQTGLGKIPIVGKLLRRIVWYFTSLITGSDISFMSHFGSGVYFPHPFGIVIGGGWVVADNATIMQSVTLGSKNTNGFSEDAGYIDENAVICTGAVVLGSVKVGKGAVLGANAVAIIDIPEYSTAVGIPAKIINGNN